MRSPDAVFSHSGYGGSEGWADRRHALALGLTKSRMGRSNPTIAAELRLCPGI